VLTTAECPSIEEVEDGVNGGADEAPSDALAACEVLEQIMERCYEPGEEPSEPAPEPEPAPLPGE
jgi:hypothetical protein